MITKSCILSTGWIQVDCQVVSSLIFKDLMQFGEANGLDEA